MEVLSVSQVTADFDRMQHDNQARTPYRPQSGGIRNTFGQFRIVPCKWTAVQWSIEIRRRPVEASGQVKACRPLLKKIKPGYSNGSRLATAPRSGYFMIKRRGFCSRLPRASSAAL